MSAIPANLAAKMRPPKRPHKIVKKIIDLIPKWKIVRGDTVYVRTGADAGKKGKVLEVVRDKNRVVVEGVNLMKKHLKPQGEQRGRIMVKEAPIHYSNVALLDPATGKPTRVAMRFLENGDKVRVAKKSGAIIEKPADLIPKRREHQVGDKDTAPDTVLKRTFFDEVAHPHLVIHQVNIKRTPTPAAKS